MFGGDIKLMKAPAMAFEDIEDVTFVLIEAWHETVGALLNWSNFKAIVIIDLENIYFLLYSLKESKLYNCFIFNLDESMWRIEKDRTETWERIRNIMKLLDIKESIDVGIDWN